MRTGSKPAPSFGAMGRAERLPRAHGRAGNRIDARFSITQDRRPFESLYPAFGPFPARDAPISVPLLPVSAERVNAAFVSARVWR
ncbi:hypothetical protein [Sphingomonas rustica]|uniref:hypothetical protein n=1 Tax=Sphingomonas rustica TaxID=3103142 RepID=UPI0031FD4B75